MLRDVNAALNIFVKSHYQSLTSDDLSLKDLKLLKRRYFIDNLKNNSGNPSNDKICKGLVDYFIRNGMEKERIVLYINSLPLFNFISDDKRMQFLETLDSEKIKSGLSEKDIELLKRAEAFKAVQLHQREEIRNRYKTEENALKRKIEEKRKEYDELESVLDHDNVFTPPSSAEIKEYKKWWERFYLKDNPFPIKDGLSKVDRDLYDSVVVKTQPYNEVLGALKKDPNYLYNTAFMLIGGFGYGKTTFMDYLSYYLVQNKILPLRITCGKFYPDARGYLDHFYIKLKTALINELGSALSRSNVLSGEIEYEDVILQLSKDILNKSKYCGIVIFMDDYHKHRTTIDNVYNFLGSLQILKDYLTRNDINIGFIASGLSEWQEARLSNTQLSGFFDSNPIVMPNLTPDIICDVFNSRINAYCYDLNSIKIKPDFVRGIFNKVSISSLGYRDYLNLIIMELEGNNFAIIDTPIELGDEELNSIKALFEEDLWVKSIINKVLFGLRAKRLSKEQIARCLELIVQLEMHDGIGERELVFKDNAYYFGQLKDAGIISKKRLPNVKEFKWVLHARIHVKIEQIKIKYNRSINDYFLKIYAYKDYGQVVDASQNDADSSITILKEIYADQDIKVSKSIKANIENAIKHYEAIVLADDSAVNVDIKTERMMQSLNYVSNAFFEIDGSVYDFAPTMIKDVEKRWDLHWYQDESISELYKRYKDYMLEKKRIQYEHLYRQFKETFQNIVNKLKVVVENTFSQKEPIITVNCTRLTDDERDIVDNVRHSYYSQNARQHFEYMNKITNHIEDKLRWYLYITTNLMFGEKRYFDYINKHDKGYAFKNMDSKQYSTVNNMFYGFTRPQFRKTMSEGIINKQIVRNLDMGWTEADWNDFFDIFIQENINTSHKQYQMYGAQHRQRYVRYCNMALELCGGINEFLGSIIKKHAYCVATNKNEVINTEDCIIYYNFKNKQRNESIKSGRATKGDEDSVNNIKEAENHIIDVSEYSKIESQINYKVKEKGYYIDDIMDVEYISNHYGATYLEYLKALTVGCHIKKSIDVFPWHGSSILIMSKN